MANPAPRKRVVIVDDDGAQRLILKAVVGSMDCDVVGEGATGDDAVALFREHRPDLMLLDVMLEGKSGPEALREIRAEFQSAVVVILTASGDLDTVQECIRYGAARYILKDGSVPRLRAKLGEAIRLVS